MYFLLNIDALRKLISDGLPKKKVFDTAAFYILEYERILDEKKREKLLEKSISKENLEKSNSLNKELKVS